MTFWVEEKITQHIYLKIGIYKCVSMFVSRKYWKDHIIHNVYLSSNTPREREMLLSEDIL